MQSIAKSAATALASGAPTIPATGSSIAPPSTTPSSGIGLSSGSGTCGNAWPAARDAFYQTLLPALADAAKRAGCSSPVTPHRLRHSFASEMLRLGVSLPALMQLLGHHDIRMTMRYVQVTQQDLQREFHAARQNTAQLHLIPTLSIPNASTRADLVGIRQALAATRHLL